ncbi:glycoside hydrolase family 36 protein [Paenibacillus wynnii]|uniref:glycoside hydrolase family 36 protein n=1 Tax=Paenibacillus wynnii TaxID=268407 RepID=UPI00068ED56D|nr:glycoside hydrolase family 36 protein [Paenibacillus wynnii]
MRCKSDMEFSNYASWSNDKLILDNGIVRRVISLPSPQGKFVTTSYQPVKGEFQFFLGSNTDFQFEVSGVVYSGDNDWTFLEITSIQDDFEGDGAAVSLISSDQKLQITLKFLMYPHLPVIRKSLVVKNRSNDDITLESVDVEKFNTIDYFPSTFSWIYSDYGRRKCIGPYEGNRQDSLIVVHNPDWESGIVLGNEASGVMKRSSVFWQAPEITCGLTHKNAEFPFRMWIQPDEHFETPQVFTMVYNNEKSPDTILNTAVPDFVRKHMGIRLSEMDYKPTFVYNTWNPFLDDINEQLILELADAAAAAGIKEFIIDDGWQDVWGDWKINTTKFPRGLKPVFDYIKSLGMIPGLWVSVGSASSKSKVFQEHPDWFVKDKHGDYANLHIDDDVMDIRSACFSTEWKNHIKAILLDLVLEHGLEYLKLDFAVVTSPYRFNSEDAGCYAANHTGHRDRLESLYVNYEHMWELFDDLHKAKPNLFIDCTFETMGGLQLIDYAMLKHAEGSWLSNFEGNLGEKTDLRIRNMAWWRSPAMPATALVIGNPEMQDEGWEMHIKSIAGALPIMLGDPRKLSDTDLKTYRFYSDWLQSMENQYGVMNYRQDLPGFGEPMEGSWDGFQRINTETQSGGIIGVFRHGAIETTRTITVHYLQPLKTYAVKSMHNQIIVTLTGDELRTKGFELALNEAYSGELFEIAEIKG